MTESNYHHHNDPVASTVCDLPVAASVNALPQQKETHNEQNKTSTNNSSNNDSKDDTAIIQKKIEILTNFLNKAQSIKQQGNACFSRHDFQTAQGHYEQALKIVHQILRNTCRPDIGHDSYDTNQGRDDYNNSNQCCWDSDLRLNVEKLLVSLVGNQAITLYKLANYTSVIDCCNSILGSSNNDCNNIKQQQLPQQQLPPQQFHYEHDVSKVYYRRALAREALRQYDLALQDVTTCMEYYLSSDGCHKNDYGKSETTEESSSLSSSSSSLQQKQRQYHDTRVALERIRSKANEQLATPVNSSSSATPLNGDHHRRRRICPVPNATTQRDVIYKLLQQSSIPRMGELFCLIDFKWWKKWCFHVDFYTKVVDMKNHCTAVSGVEEDLWLSYHIPQLSSARPRHEFDDDDVCMTEDGTYSNDSSKDSYKDYMENDDEYDYDDDDDKDDEYDDDDDECDEYKITRPYRKIRKPGVIDNSRLLINANQSPTDQFLEEWNSNNNHGGMETTSTFSRTSANRMQLKPQLVRGHHFEIVPREVYSALRAWYGELTPTIMRRAMAIPPQYPKPVVFLYPQRNIGLLIQQQQQHLFIGNPTVYDPTNGRIGLTNLGNTCFMNAALQCLSHSTPLTRYFLTNQYESEINITNPIGTGGKLAIAYEAMIRQLWIPKKKQSSISPRALKRAIALFAPRFAGTMQQDSQEFLAFFLDGLHEDLNRIRNPPYIEKADVTHEHDLYVAGAEAWDAHCRRNQSIVMDTFYGQFKSTCICPKCKQISVSFDAFNHVSLEIPQLSNFGTIVAIVLFRANLPAEPPQRYGILVPKHAQMNDVKHQLSVLSQIPTERLAICDIYQSNIYEIIDDNKNVAALNHDDVIVAYEIDPYTNSTIHAIATHAIPTSETESVGYPLFMSFNVNLTCSQVNEYIRSRLAYIIPEGATFQVKLVENNGKPMPVFPNLSTSSRLDSFSSVIPDSEDTMTSFLSDDCAESYLFMKIEWTPNISVVSRINFEKYANHPSLNEAITKHRSMLNKTLTLDQCLENFTQPERLDEDNKWYCSRCKDHVRAEKKMTLWRLPNILVIHLKRFEFRNALRREKLDSLVEFPLDGLDMSKYCGSLSVQQNNGDERISLQNEFVVNDIPAVYDLFGVINHYGRMGFGHYNAYARRWNECKMEDEWMLFDDSSVRGGISRADVVSNAGYILFYRRRNFA